MLQKLSGAQGRKRRTQYKQDAKRSSMFLESFLGIKKVKSDVDGNQTYKPINEADNSDDGTSDSDPDKGPNEDDKLKESNSNPSTTSHSYGASTSNKTIDESEFQPPGHTSGAVCADDAIADDGNEAVNMKTAVIIHKDVGYINFSSLSGQPIINRAVREEMVKLGAAVFQNTNSNLPKVQFGIKAVSRGMTQNWFLKDLPNGNQVQRTWLIFSPLKEAAFCFCCLLFQCSPQNARSAFESRDGFTNWKKIEKLKFHEDNVYHRKSFVEWKELELRLKKGKGIDMESLRQIQEDQERWRNILMRVLDTTKLLSSQNLALRCHVENLDNKNLNPGNFIAILKFLSKYDQVIANHLTHVQENPGSKSYLSPQIQNEFISLLAGKVRDTILSEIREAKYFGILFDSTPDVSHTEQLSQVIRYVRINFETGAVSVRETFIDFLELTQKDAAGYEEIIISKLENDKLNFQDCRAQMYDNANVMSGHLTGVQARLTERNSKAIFINCDNHSLNLAGVHAASVDPSLVTFFGTVEQVYAFFAGSTNR